MKNIFRGLLLVMALFIGSFADEPPTSIDVYYVGNDCYATGVFGCNIQKGQELSGVFSIYMFLNSNYSASFAGVTATAPVSLYAGSTLILDWHEPTDYISIASLDVESGAKVQVADGKSFYADGVVYRGVLSAAQVSSIAGKILKPIHGVTFTKNGEELNASLCDTCGYLIIPEDIDVSHVVHERTFVENVYSTVMFPFETELSDVEGLAFLEFGNVSKDESGWYILASELSAPYTIRANTPYLVKASQGEIRFNAPVTLENNTGGSNSVSVGTNWDFQGTYQRIDWETNISLLSRAYGFAAKSSGGLSVGQFAKFGIGAFTKPMRCFLLYKPAAAPKPEQIAVRIVEKNGTTRIIGTLEKASLNIRPRQWTDTKGRAHSKRPTAKGFYIEGKNDEQ